MDNGWRTQRPLSNRSNTVSVVDGEETTMLAVAHRADQPDQAKLKLTDQSSTTDNNIVTGNDAIISENEHLSQDTTKISSKQIKPLSNSTPHTGALKHRSASTGSSYSAPQLEGWLFKWTNYIKLYQKRWFVLKQNSLSYFRSPSETGLTCRGTISLIDACIQAEEGNNFVISHGNQAYHLRASNEIERQRWIMMLELAKSRQYPNNRTPNNNNRYGTNISNQTTHSDNSHTFTKDWRNTPNDCTNRDKFRTTINNSNNSGKHSKNQVRQQSSEESNLSNSQQIANTARLQSSASNRAQSPTELESALETNSEDEDEMYSNKISPIHDVIEISTKDLSKKLVNLKQQAAIFNESISKFANSLIPLYNHHVMDDIKATNTKEPQGDDRLSSEPAAPFSKAVETLDHARLSSTNIPKDQQKIYSKILENAARVQESLSSLTNISSIYVETAEEHQKKWKKSIVREQSNRLKLEDLVEQLARQQSEYEEEFFDAEEGSQQEATNNTTSNQDGIRFISSPGGSTRIQSPNDNQIGRKLSACMRSKSRSLESRLSDDVIDNNGADTDTLNCGSHLKTIGKHMPLLGNNRNTSDITVAEPASRTNEYQGDNFSSLSSVKSIDNMQDRNIYSTEKLHLNNNEPATNSKTISKVTSANETVIQRKRRTTIPDRLNQSLNLWSILKNCMGKELTKIPIPVNFNEPLSMLQRLTEDYEYANELLHPAAKLTDPLEQMVYVAIFAVSSYSTTSNRTGKPFNPLLGETYECDRMDDLGWKCINEQVSHHPPMMASHCQGQGWVSWREFGMSSKFRGKYLQVTPQDYNCLEIGKNIYVWKKVDTCVHNIIVGKLWVDHEGEMVITNHTTGDKCKLKFLPYSYFSRDIPKKVSGFVFDRNDKPQWLIDGTWDHEMKFSKVTKTILDKNGGQTVQTADSKILWQRRYPGPEYEKMYNMTKFAVQLNELEDNVAPTDSRLRPDQRLMEIGKWDDSNRTKCQLEEKQRSSRRIREAAEISKNNSDKTIMKESSNSSSLRAVNESTPESDNSTRSGTVPSPLDGPFWFEKKLDPITKKTVHKYTDEYWQCKEKADWSRCPDIF